MEENNKHKPQLESEAAKFKGKEVEVEYLSGAKVKTLKGTVVYLNYNYFNCIVMTKTDKIIVRNVITIKRKAGE